MSDTLWSVFCFSSQHNPMHRNLTFWKYFLGSSASGLCQIYALGSGHSYLPLPGMLPLFLHSGVRSLGSLSWACELDQGHLISLQSLSLSSLGTHSASATPISAHVPSRLLVPFCPTRRTKRPSGAGTRYAHLCVPHASQGAREARGLCAPISLPPGPQI